MARALPHQIEEAIDYEIRGFHVYKKVWKPRMWQHLYVIPEQQNPYDITALAVTETDQHLRGSCNIIILLCQIFTHAVFCHFDQNHVMPTHIIVLLHMDIIINIIIIIYYYYYYYYYLLSLP